MVKKRNFENSVVPVTIDRSVLVCFHQSFKHQQYQF